MKKKLFLILIATIAINCVVNAQYSKSEPKSNTENIFFESIVYQSSNSADSNVVYFFYKIRLTELIFDKSDEIKLNSFSAYPTIEVEIKDNTGIIRKRLLKKDTVTIEDYSLINKQDQYFEGFFKSKLMPNDYVVHYQITVNNRDIYDKRINIDNSKKNNLKIIGNPIIFNLSSGTDVNYIPTNFNNCVDIKSTNSTFLLFTKPNDKRLLTASISYVKDSGNPPKNYPSNFNTKVVNLDNKGIDFLKTGNEIKGSLTNNDNSTIYQIEIPMEVLYPGKFILNIIDKSKKDTVKYEYKVQWVDKPNSLNDNSYVQELMSYILTDDEIHEFHSAKNEDQYLFNFWQKLDPTPKTYYNEAMNAYFTRADEAKTKFMTVYHKDGALTPRGKIYMLYGNPDSMVNELKEAKPIERWVYSKLKKQFIFEIVTPGEYKLIQVKE